MSSASPHDLDEPVRRETTTSLADWIGAAGAALAVQVGAALLVSAAAMIFFAGILTGFGDTSASTPGWTAFAVPVAVAGVAVFVLSGWIAARIAGDRRGWLMLIAGPLMWLLLSAATSAF